jgi:hypothetical protein
MAGKAVVNCCGKRRGELRGKLTENCVDFASWA